MFIWRKRLNTILNKNSQILHTEKGPIEYAIYGHGPIVVGLHGAPGGYDQIICLADGLAKQGFEIIGWSRSGYLRTPLSVGKTFEEQADALALLLDHLLIDKASLLAISAGGPVAMHFAVRHPDRIHCLIMEAAITKQHQPEFIERNKRMFKLTFNDVGLWLYHWILHLAPKKALRKFLSFESDLKKKELDDLIEQIIQNPKKMEFFEKLLQSFAPMSRRKKGFYNDLDQLKKFTDFPYDKIQCSTLIIHGTADKDVPIDHAENLANKLSQCEFHKIEKGTHLLNFSNAYFKAEEKIISYLKNE